MLTFPANSADNSYLQLLTIQIFFSKTRQPLRGPGLPHYTGFKIALT